MKNNVFEQVRTLMIEAMKAKGQTKDLILYNLTAPVDVPVPKSLFTVEVRHSKLHGNGIFATEEITEGDVITAYPCHWISYSPKDRRQIRIVARADDFNTMDPDNIACKDYASFVHEDGDDTVHIVGNPEAPLQREACAHLINDPYPTIGNLNVSPESSKDFGQALLQYELLAQQYANCRLESRYYYVYAVATKTIKVGEEILAPYGYPYWCQHNMKTITRMMTEYFQDLTESQKIWAGKVMKSSSMCN